MTSTPHDWRPPALPRHVPHCLTLFLPLFAHHIARAASHIACLLLYVLACVASLQRCIWELVAAPFSRVAHLLADIPPRPVHRVTGALICLASGVTDAVVNAC